MIATRPDFMDAELILKGHRGKVHSVAFSPDGRLLATASEDQAIRLWDVSTGEERTGFMRHALAVYCLAFAPDGRTLASGGEEGTVRLWDVASGRERLRLCNGSDFLDHLDPRQAGSYGDFDESDDLDGEVTALAYSPDGRQLAFGDFFGTVALCDPATGQKTGTLNGDGYQVAALAYSPDGTTLVTGYADGNVILRDARDGRERTRFEVPDMVSSVAYSPDGTMLACGSWGLGQGRKLFGKVTLWNVGSRRARGIMQVDREAALTLAYAPDGRHLAVAEGDPFDPAQASQLMLWDTNTGDLRCVLEEQAGLISALAYAPGGRALAAGEGDGTVRLWHLADGPAWDGPSGAAW